MGVEQKIRRHHDGAEQIVEIVRNVASKPADGLHLLLLVDLVLERALRRGLQRIDDHRLALALLFPFDRNHEKSGKALARAGKGGIDRRNFPVPARRPANGAFQCSAIPACYHRENRALD